MTRFLAAACFASTLAFGLTLLGDGAEEFLASEAPTVAQATDAAHQRSFGASKSSVRNGL